MPLLLQNINIINGSFANGMFEFTVDHEGNVLDEPVVAVKEMVRDQPHSYDNIEGMAILAQTIAAQGTLLDPVAGTATTNADGVDVYSFMDDRLLKGTNFYYKYNMGYKVPFNDGNNNPVSSDRRGRIAGRRTTITFTSMAKARAMRIPISSM